MKLHRRFHYHRRLHDRFLQNLARKEAFKIRIKKHLLTSLSLSFISCSSSSSSSSLF
jgi:hypothetical protein